MSVKKALEHFKTVCQHRREVRKNCFRMGLYRQGLTHDLSKFSWTEFRIGAKYFMEDQSPHNGERKEYGYSTAWLHHKGRNRHHLEYWMDYDFLGDHHVAGMRMPEKYVAEMVADRVAASKIYKKEKYTDSSALEYYMGKRDYHILHPETRALLEKLLMMLAEKGEDYTFRYIRSVVLKRRGRRRLLPTSVFLVTRRRQRKPFVHTVGR